MGELTGTFVWKCEQCGVVIIRHCLKDLRAAKAEHRCRRRT